MTFEQVAGEFPDPHSGCFGREHFQVVAELE